MGCDLEELVAMLHTSAVCERWDSRLLLVVVADKGVGRSLEQPHWSQPRSGSTTPTAPSVRPGCWAPSPPSCTFLTPYRSREDVGWGCSAPILLGQACCSLSTSFLSRVTPPWARCPHAARARFCFQGWWGSSLPAGA